MDIGIIEILGYLGALMVGMVLGLMGSGGSLIAIPIFTYIFHINPITTTAYSLFVVGTSASIGALRNWNKGLVDFRIAIVFAIPAFIAVYVVRKYVLPIIPMEILTINGFILTKNMVIMVFLAISMLLCSLSMIRGRKSYKDANRSNNYNYPLLVLYGIIIGLFTGIAGIGGGFLIIPVLVLLIKLPMRKAIATSLLIIAVKSIIGFSGDLNNLVINWSFLVGFTVIATIGIFLGIYLSSFIKGEMLKKHFGWLLMIIAVGIIYKEVFI